MNDYADRPETRVPMERRSAIAAALDLIRETGDLQQAQALLMESVHRQSRWSAGIKGQHPELIVLDEAEEFTA